MYLQKYLKLKISVACTLSSKASYKLRSTQRICCKTRDYSIHLNSCKQNLAFTLLSCTDFFLLNYAMQEFLQNFSHLQKNTVYLYQTHFRYVNCLMSNRAADTAAGERVSTIPLITLWQPHQMFTDSHSPSQITFKAED